MKKLSDNYVATVDGRINIFVLLFLDLKMKYTFEITNDPEYSAMFDVF